MPEIKNDGKVALITGANRGIGFETAKQLGEQGVTVLLASRKLEDAEAAVARLKSAAIDAYPVKLDVTSDADRTAAARYIAGTFGKLDILINNAGVASSNGFTPIVIETGEAELQSIFTTNVFAIVAITRELLPLLKKSPAGRIVNLSSILGSNTLHADPNGPIYNFKSFAYDASKAALNSFTIHLAWELKDTPIKVNSAHPGWVKTDMGTDAAPMEIPDGARTSVELALLGPEGPNGRFIHMGEELPW